MTTCKGPKLKKKNFDIGIEGNRKKVWIGVISKEDSGQG